MLTIDASVWVSAFDATDVLHESCRDFVRTVTRDMVALRAPSFVLVETACAVARRVGSPDVGRDVAREVAASPHLALIQTDADLEQEALRLGTECRLRAADALYVAVAVRTGSVLITTDRELGARVPERIVTMTPGEWLATRPN